MGVIRHYPLILGMLIWVSCETSETKSLRIAVSANMQFAMTEIAAAFDETYNLPVETIVSSSGKLTAQILQGAPYDLFASADLIYPDTLYRSGLTTSAPIIYAYGQLMAWSKVESFDPETFNILDYPTIAIANPSLAPYGKAAVQMIEYYKWDLDRSEHLVYGESIAQVNQYILSQAVELAFTASSTAVIPAFKKVGAFIPIDSSAYAPIAQAIVAMETSAFQESTQLFLDFMTGNRAKEILTKYGYTLPKNNDE